MKNKEFKNELFFNWIDDECFRNELSEIINEIKINRKENQSEISKFTEIPLTKVKQIENGTCVDFNAIINYINYLSPKRISVLY
jgi:hypothetical protein